MVYEVKLNPLDKPNPLNEPEWLLEYEDVFPKDHTQLPPPRDVDHAIELIPEALGREWSLGGPLYLAI